jgi:hypothetical protein
MEDFGGLVVLLFMMVLYVGFFVAVIAGMWKVYAKAGQPGWAAIIPLYNAYVLMKIAGKPGWWFLLLFVPFVNFIVLLIVSMDVAKAFGKSSAYGIILLFFFSILGYLMLGFGSAEYVGTGAVTPEAPAAE